MPALIGDHYFLGGLQINQHILAFGDAVCRFALPGREHPKAIIGKIRVFRLPAFHGFPPHLSVASKVKDDDLLARVPQSQVAALVQHSLHAVFLVGKGRNLMGAERELLEKIAVVQQQSIIGAENLLISHSLGAQGNRFEGSPVAIEVIEDLVLKIAGHPRQEEVIPCEGSSQWHEAVAVLSDKPVTPRFSNGGVQILIDKSFPHLAHHGAGRLAFDLKGGVAQDLLDLPAIQAGSDGLIIYFNSPLFVRGGVDKGFFDHGFDCFSLRIRMLFPSALMLYRSSRWMWNPSSRMVSAISKTAFASRSSPARLPRQL